MLRDMDVLSRVLGVQSRNLALNSADLVCAARQVSSLAIFEGLEIAPLDKTGERIIGAASASRFEFKLANITTRLDQKNILLVAGEIAGPSGIALRASIILSMGARRVDAAVLGGWDAPIDGCHRLWSISLPAEASLQAI